MVDNPEAYRSFSLEQPLSTHWRRASCEEVGCRMFLTGWVTTLSPDDDLVAWVRRARRGQFVEGRDETSGHLTFTFAPGTSCFETAEHIALRDRPPLYLVRDAHYLAPSRVLTSVPQQRHSGADPWLDDFAGNQDRLTAIANRR